MVSRGCAGMVFAGTGLFLAVSRFLVLVGQGREPLEGCLEGCGGLDCTVASSPVGISRQDWWHACRRDLH